MRRQRRVCGAAAEQAGEHLWGCQTQSKIRAPWRRADGIKSPDPGFEPGTFGARVRIRDGGLVGRAIAFWYWIAFEPGQRAGAESRGRMMRWNRRAVFLRPRNHAAARALARRRGGRMCNRAERCAPQPRGHAPQPREHRAINGGAEKPIDFFMLRWSTKRMRWTQKCRRRVT